MQYSEMKFVHDDNLFCTQPSPTQTYDNFRFAIANGKIGEAILISLATATMI